jgi:hypothetical protein
MASEAKLSHTAAMILQAIDAGLFYGFSIMEMTGLPSGTVYPAMRRLECEVEAEPFTAHRPRVSPGPPLRPKVLRGSRSRVSSALLPLPACWQGRC